MSLTLERIVCSENGRLNSVDIDLLINARPGTVRNERFLIWTIRELASAGLSTARELLSGDLPLCDRFRERRPPAFSEEKSSSRVQRNACESAPKLVESCSKLPRGEDEKKWKRDIPITNCFTRQNVYHGYVHSQLASDKSSVRNLLNADFGIIFSSKKRPRKAVRTVKNEIRVPI
jgi:hypothetical protein